MVWCRALTAGTVGEMDEPAHSLVVPHRFCGPPSSGNGGWTAGALAAQVRGCPGDHRTDQWPPVEVSLRRPPPLDVPLALLEQDRVLSATGDAGVVATAQCMETELVEVEPVNHDVAVSAAAEYPGLRSHPFPTCFVCGTGREEGDGLRIFPGAVEPTAEGRNRVAAPWTPHASLAEDFHTYADAEPRASLPVTWAALDCAGAWAADMGERLMVLARMRARVDTLPVLGEPHVVMGEARGQEGRKSFTATTLYDAEGRVVGTAEHLWIEVDPADFA